MKLDIVPLTQDRLAFVQAVYTQNLNVLHGLPISMQEWEDHLLGKYSSSNEASFLITADGENAAWLKLNGLEEKSLCISMLVVQEQYRRRRIGSFAVRYAEKLAKNRGQTAVEIQTTADNSAAIACYTSLGYSKKAIQYSVGDAIKRDGYVFTKAIDFCRQKA